MNFEFGYALLLSTLAGLSTTLGGLAGIVVNKPKPRFMAVALGFSAGVMIFISFIELLQAGIDTIGFNPAIIAFFVGMIVMYIIDELVPHEYMAEQHRTDEDVRRSQMVKTGLFVALGIGIHNLPEGMATFTGALEDPKLGIAIAIAVALHNIPEGIAVSAPIYAATGNRLRALLFSFFSGLAEPIGAGLAAIVLYPILNDVVLGYLLAIVAGIMVFISLDELIPTARSFGEEHLSILGLIGGMIVIAFSIGILR
jgi:ZIP family zinc transporter